MNDFSLLSVSRIVHIAQSQSIEQARRMRLVDKIIDVLAGGIRREAIESLFDCIASIKVNPWYHEDDSGRLNNEKERLKKFLQLRSLAPQEHRHQFRFDIWNHITGAVGCSFHIGDAEIYRNDRIYGIFDEAEIWKLFAQKLRLDLEDAVNTSDTYATLRTLDEADAFISRSWPMKRMTAEQRRAFPGEQMAEIFKDLPSETKMRVLEVCNGEFGKRIRGVLRFAHETLMKAAEQPQSAPRAAIRSAAAPKTVSLRQWASTGERLSKPLALEALLHQLLAVCSATVADETAAQGVNLNSVEGAKPTTPQSLPAVTLINHLQLTEAERRALHAIGVPDPVLRLI
ncbi:hypothetical protein [Bordetella sp. 02P26C-1]|uniref:hypothetical protein n=1 Tax=Bordetella sp. 02P26C-1 TaxID=2683195 RepID=UPI001355DF77|nr:hypothetical protein [Bordetella sp. 02P26C-1]MVW77734.1 hypothetical protein [Bordetella sp. 02P26C-1]